MVGALRSLKPRAQRERKHQRATVDRRQTWWTALHLQATKLGACPWLVPYLDPTMAKLWTHFRAPVWPQFASSNCSSSIDSNNSSNNYLGGRIKSRSMSPPMNVALEDESYDEDVCESTPATSSASTPSSVSSRNKFNVNKYYDVVSELDDNGRMVKWHLCKAAKCDQRYTVRTGGAAKEKHASAHRNYGNDNNEPPFSTLSREEQNNIIIRLIVTAGLAFSIVEHPDFRRATGYSPSRHTISQLIQQRYEQERQVLRHRLNSLDFIAITTDIWTSITNRAYSCYTGYFVENGKIKSALIDLIPMPHTHTASALQNKIERDSLNGDTWLGGQLLLLRRWQYTLEGKYPNNPQLTT